MKFPLEKFENQLDDDTSQREDSFTKRVLEDTLTHEKHRSLIPSLDLTNVLEKQPLKVDLFKNTIE